MVVERVRRETSSLHESVEQKLQLVSPGLTLTHYIRVLQAFLGFFEPCEAALDAACPDELRHLWANTARAQKLRADLRALGTEPDPPHAGAPVAPIEDAGVWLGTLYVVEGSRLGGQHIARHVEKHFRWVDGRGYSFFVSEPAELRRRWRTVCAALEEHDGLCNQIVQGSHRTFDYLEKYLKIAL